LQDLCDHWSSKFDWRAQEERFNRWPHFLTDIDDQQIHFIHARSDDPNALPLIITHGWPGSVAEFLDVIEPLRAAFHVVAPSLPGYGWSGVTTESGWDAQRVAQAWKTLMARLGYERYGAQGGDWGAMVSARLAAIDAEHVIGLHSNMLLAFPADPSSVQLDEQETADLAAAGEFMTRGAAYQEIQGKNPQTLGYGLTDSPSGLAGWIVEKFRAWTDCDGDVERCLTKDVMLDNIMLYWLTGTAHSAGRLYYEIEHGGTTAPNARVAVPVGVAAFPREVLRFPRSWAEPRYNLVRWTDMPQGGHFAALEQPELLIDDVRSFFRLVR
jgi:pimeloyl-ACP methyl ester carboxylesterase